MAPRRLALTRRVIIGAVCVTALLAVVVRDALFGDGGDIIAAPSGAPSSVAVTAGGVTAAATRAAAVAAPPQAAPAAIDAAPESNGAGPAADAPPSTAAPSQKEALAVQPGRTPTGAVQCKTLQAPGYWVNNVTHPGLEKERWWATTDPTHEKYAGHWHTSDGENGCEYTMMTGQQIRECMRNRKIAIIGDSLVRNMLNTLIMFTYPNDPMPLKVHEDVTKRPDPSMGTTFEFVWRPLSQAVGPPPPQLLDADVVLYGVGVWDVASGGGHSISPSDFYNNLRNQLMLWQQINFRRPTMVFYAIHNVSRDKHRTCYTESRINAFRAATRCALQEAGGGWSVIDALPVTTAAPDVFYDPDWTHIKGTLLESITHVFLNAMCGLASGPQESSCDRDAGAAWRSMPRCDFNNPR